MEKLLKTEEDKEQFLFWVSTLMAEYFKKGQGRLEEQPGQYCCLGVATILTVPDNSIENVIGNVMPYEPAPLWLRNVVSHSYTKTGQSIVGMNDGDYSHKEIGEFLLETYADELD